MPNPGRTLANIRAQLAELAALASQRALAAHELRRAQSLVGSIVHLGLSPRALGLSLRQMRLNPRAARRPPRTTPA